MDESSDWLAQHGGWVLLAFGIAVVAAAVLVADHDPVASVLGFAGVATAVFGVVLSRLEGAFEISPTKISATLRKARQVGVRDDLTLEEKADAILGLLGVGAPSGTAASEEEAAPSVTQDASPKREASIPKLPRPTPFVATVDEGRPVHAAMAFEKHVEADFARQGWDVQEQTHDVGVDLFVSKDNFRAAVEIKLRRQLSLADARAFLNTAMLSIEGGRVDGAILAVADGTLSRAAEALLDNAQSVAVLRYPVVGWW